MSDFSKFLKLHKLFSELNNQQLETVEQLIKELKFQEGEIIVEEGKDAKEIFIILDGEVEVLKKQESGDLYRLVTLKSGSVIGEMSLLEDIPRAATIRAITPTQFLSLPINKLRNLRKAKTCEERAIYYMISEKIAHELCLRLRAANQTMVEFLHTDKLETEATVASNSFWSNLFRL